MRKTILITGASSGLGEGMARLFAAKNRDLALCARRTDRLEALRAELMAAHPGIRILVKALDVNDYDSVFIVFREFAAELGGLDRVIVNAGLGKGAPIGTGYFRANRQTAETNFIGALAQCEAALEIFRKQNQGHLVMVSSISAMRGMPGPISTYAATKAAVKALTEGIRLDLWKSPIKVTTIYPGYIRSEMNEKLKNTPFIVDTMTGCRALVAAIEREPDEASVPPWPWKLMGFLLRNLPLGMAKRLM
jgi:NADP-dependent 3-hydroxy acid dehydrogenase YdfG